MILTPPYKKEKKYRFEPYFLNKPTEVSYINESLGGFSNQYEIAERLAQTVMQMHDNRINTLETTLDIDGAKIPFVVKISGAGVSNQAQIIPLGTKNENGEILECLELTVFIPVFSRFANDKEELYKDVKTQITHELMHGNIFSKRSIAGVKIDDMPQYYSACINIIENDIGPIKDIAYAIYATYYHEIQANVSSVYSELNCSINEENVKFLQNSNYDYMLKVFKMFLMNTEAYKIYYYIVNTVCKKFFNYNENGIKELEKELESKGLVLQNGLVAIMKKVQKLAEGALKDVVRNGVLYFNTVLNPQKDENK